MDRALVCRSWSPAGPNRGARSRRLTNDWAKRRLPVAFERSAAPAQTDSWRHANRRPGRALVVHESPRPLIAVPAFQTLHEGMAVAFAGRPDLLCDPRYGGCQRSRHITSDRSACQWFRPDRPGSCLAVGGFAALHARAGRGEVPATFGLADDFSRSHDRMRNRTAGFGTELRNGRPFPLASRRHTGPPAPRQRLKLSRGFTDLERDALSSVR